MSARGNFSAAKRWVWLAAVGLIACQPKEPTLEHDGTLRIELLTAGSLDIFPNHAHDGAKKALAEFGPALAGRKVAIIHRDLSYIWPENSFVYGRGDEPLPHLALALGRNSTWIHSWASAHGVITADFRGWGPQSSAECGALALRWRAFESYPELVRRHLLPDRRVTVGSHPQTEYAWGEMYRQTGKKHLTTYLSAAWSRTGPPQLGDLVVGPQLETDFAGEAYSLVRHYLRAVVATGTTRPAAVLPHMKATAVDDTYVRNGRLREDGRLVMEHQIFSYADNKWQAVRTLTTAQVDQATPSASAQCQSLSKNR